MTFDIAIDAVNDLIIEEYLIEEENEGISEVAKEATIEMISDIYYLSAKAEKLMEE